MEAPRVNASMLTQYSGKTVCLVGNVTEVSTKKECERSTLVFDVILTAAKKYIILLF